MEGMNQAKVTLPDGTEIADDGPIVIIGPNGSGKTRRSRLLSLDGSLDVISALRSTKISPQLQAMTLQNARATYTQHRAAARSAPHELSTDFDFMLTTLMGEASESSMEYMRATRAGEMPALPPPVALEKVQDLWADVFPGRMLRFRDFLPLVINSVAVGDEPVEYSAWQMSDGEKAALYLAGRAFTSEPGSGLLVDEPETHFHSLLAIRFWDAIERARPDIRFIYATHDMAFAASRRAMQYLLADPLHGLTPITLADDAEDLAAVLLGTASLSFFAKRVVFCEGTEDGLDAELYGAWFSSTDVVVRPVGSCDVVMRSVSALRNSRIVQNLEVQGIIDRDFRPNELIEGTPLGVESLPVHEVESLFALPQVVMAVAAHIGNSLTLGDYEQRIIAAYSDAQKQSVIVERWKMRMGALISSLVSKSVTQVEGVEDVKQAIPGILEPAHWDFSPTDILSEEEARVLGPFDAASANVAEILKVMPGKQLRAVVGSALGMKYANMEKLVISALRQDVPELADLGAALRTALADHIPHKSEDQKA